MLEMNSKKFDVEGNTENLSLSFPFEKYHLCDHCIGRLCTRREKNETFKDAGKRYRKNNSNIKENPVNHCELCQGLLNDLSDFLYLVNHTISEYEFTSFLIGCVIDEEILQNEQNIIQEFGLNDTASIKQEINEYIGLKLEDEPNRVVDFKHPDIMIILNTQFNVISLQIKPLYVYGRYNKYRRDLPQTKWFCRRCHGKGCRYCNYTGKLYNDSVEELIAKPFIESAQAEDEAFHGAGREDIDVRMLGSGRPFVLEIKNPKKRTISLSKITQEIERECIGSVKVNSLKMTEASDISRIKSAHFQKVYVVKIHASVPIQKEKLKKVALSLQGTTINQQTPTRVEKRRANKIRKRQIYRCNVLDVNETMASLEIESESGTYIKELVTGDNGKTQPNISQLLNIACEVESLDVKEVKGE
jgi:tRNA pseudouridine synthase 10